MAAFSQTCGAALTADDLAAHQVEWVEPISTPFGDRTVHEIPPNGQGIAALIALGILEQLPYRDTAPGSAARMHLEIRGHAPGLRRPVRPHRRPGAHGGHAAQLLAPAYLQRRAALIDPQRAGSYPPGQPSSGGTVYLCAADAQGRMVSFIQSNFKGFGSGVVVPGTGIALHNRGMGFVTPGHPNQVAGGKRPMHSIIPAFMLRNGQPHMAFGVMGGNMQAQGHLQMTLREAVEGLNPRPAAMRRAGASTMWER
jgi:gamma-glutamyltranspeptidase/glutathione hydrolase